MTDTCVNAISGDEAGKLSADELIEQLHSDSKQGLSSTEVKSRCSQFGYNEIPEKKVSPWMKLLKNFWGPIPWMIEAAFILSAINKDWDDVAVIGALLLINAFIEFVQSNKADNAIAKLKAGLAQKAKVLRDGDWKEIEARELVPGDMIRIRLGDIIPADVKLLSGDYLSIDESALTGESLPVEKHAGDVAYSGSIAKQGEMNAVVYGTALNTFFGHTAKLVAEAKTTSHFQKAVVRIGDYLIALDAVFVLIVVLTGLFRHEHAITVIQFALVLTVASIPAALPAVLSVTMAVGAVKLSKKKAIVSKLLAIEELAGMDILCSDKTGTITKNQLSVAGVSPVGSFSESDILFYGSLASKKEDNDPIDMAIMTKFADDDKLLACAQDEFKPFDPVAKRTEATITQDGKRFKVTKGAPQVILALLEKPGRTGDKVTKIVEEAGTHGYRTLGVGVTDEKGRWKYAGLISLEDPPRDDSAVTIQSACDMGVNVKMITGDHGAIAKEVAHQVGIGQNILEAESLNGLPDRKATALVEGADGFSQVFPEHKYEIVDLLQKHRHIVGMTGDGVNDAPALKKADCGIAVAGATDAAKSAADIVLTLPGLSVIVDAIQESRRIFQRMQSYAIYRISETLDVLIFTVLAILAFHQYPVTAIMIVMLAVFNDFPIMAISYDNVIYEKKPDIWKMSRVITVGSLLGITNVLFTFLVFYLGKEWVFPGADNFKYVQTLVFAELAIAGNMTVFLARCRGPFWSIMPGKGLIWSSLISKIIVSMCCAFGWLMAPIGGWVLVIWVYAALQMLITDRMKLFAYKLVDEEVVWDRKMHQHRKAHSGGGGS